MERRDFLKISAATGAAAALEGCGNPDHQLIRFIPEEDLIPGVATWKPSICTLCPAGCGMLVRVMQGEAEVVRNGQLGILKMGLAKKIEGNPAHPISQGKLCPRGHAALQVTYHPDRIKNPLQRAGERGSGQFKEISWDDAIKQLVAQLSPLLASKRRSQLAILASPLRGQRKNIVESFATAFGGSYVREFAFFDETAARAANATIFSQPALPTVDLSHANYVISFGADFLGTWNSAVAQSVAYGKMRKGRPGQRGKFVHVEPRLSQTAANADEWIPCKPGTEGAVALSLAHVILRDNLRPAIGGMDVLIEGWSQGLPGYAPEKISEQTGVPADKITRIASEAAASSPAVVLVGGAAGAQTNGVFNCLAANALNALLGAVNRPGGLQFGESWQIPQAVVRPALRIPPGVELKLASAAENTPCSSIAIQSFVNAVLLDPGSTTALLLYGANPVFAAWPDLRIREALAKIPFISSFDSFLNETTEYADLILPDHSPLESWLDDAPPSGDARTIASLAPPAMNPLHNTRAMPDVLLEVAQQLRGELSKPLPWKTYDEALKAAFTGIYKTRAPKEAKDADEFWNKVQAQGGWWSAEAKLLPTGVAKIPGGARKNTPPEFDGDASQFPFHFLPFASQLLYDGSLAHLPWMQEAPDPLSSVMWGTWIEINTRTAEKLGVKMGDTVEVASAHGKLQAPALVTPAIAPDVVAMPVGQGHTNFTRYATNRGANPISILAPMHEFETGSLAWAATRVKISRVGEGKIVMFGASMEETPADTKHR
jgi:menaquinone reductase, molybdopterin-binding-like subunit